MLLDEAQTVAGGRMLEGSSYYKLERKDGWPPVLASHGLGTGSPETGARANDGVGERSSP